MEHIPKALDNGRTQSQDPLYHQYLLLKAMEYSWICSCFSVRIMGWVGRDFPISIHRDLLEVLQAGLEGFNPFPCPTAPIGKSFIPVSHWRLGWFSSCFQGILVLLGRDVLPKGWKRARPHSLPFNLHWSIQTPLVGPKEWSKRVEFSPFSQPKLME